MSVILFSHSDGYCHDECHSDEFNSDECHSDECNFNKCHSSECHSAVFIVLICNLLGMSYNL
jgi:hypothetical protein